jgi:murein DD-endopeptidase MepM/ murein hydrolase activator NlpD
MTHRRLQPHARLAAILGLLAVSACAPVRDAVTNLFDSRTPRERYQDALVAAGLAKSALVRDWLAAAHHALNEAPLVSTPHVERGLLHASDVLALGYKVNARRGQEITFVVTLADPMAAVFIDVWYVDEEADVAATIVAHADSGARTIRFRPRRDGVYVLRAQPELLRAGKFTASVRIDASLAFPVHGAGARDIKSVFGDSRDGGARAHHGIDIFARRGTPVVAAAPGYVSRVGTTEIGGNVVWLRDTSGNRLYYAHLDRWYVREGAEVRTGDTLGFVGNTGNARTTPPHLHFGVYRRGEGPADPFWFVYRPARVAPRLVADTTALGTLMRGTARGVVVRAAPSLTAETTALLGTESQVRIYGASASWYRVRMANGATGYLQAETVRRAITTELR